MNNTEIVEFFSKRFENVIDNSNVSIEKLSELSGISIEKIKCVIEKKEMLSVSEIFNISQILNVPPYWFLLKPNNFFDSWHVTLEELEDLIVHNPSLRGFINGYLAESKVRHFFENDKRVTKMMKFDDHDRTNKNDLVVTYKDVDISFEIKSLQTKTVKVVNPKTNELTATFQCDASDRRIVTLQNGETVETTCLRYGDFDILAINLFAFHGEWEYAFALNRDLPCTDSKKYPEHLRSYLIKSSIKITYPLQYPFVSDPYILLEKVRKEKQQ